MGNIKLLDCTLRDGGYVNNWMFGYDMICDTIKELEKSNVDIIELGFLKNEEYIKDRTVFNDIGQISSLIHSKKRGMEYAAMVEVVNPIPADMLREREEPDIDIIRVIIWKQRRDSSGEFVDALEDGFNYCKQIVEKGYQLCVQPARVDQYSDEEFINMLNMFQKLNPKAVYIVDSWGTQNPEQVMHYVKLADNILKDNIAIGLHCHNNLMQAYANSVIFSEADIDRELIVDASVYGIGRGAGNLNTELFAKHLNYKNNACYNINSLIRVYDKYISKIRNDYYWGYCIPYYLTALYNCNPNYGEYLGIKNNISSEDIENFISGLSEVDKIIFNREKADVYIRQLSEES